MQKITLQTAKKLHHYSLTPDPNPAYDLSNFCKMKMQNDKFLQSENGLPYAAATRTSINMHET
ncbi:MAG: hypothetical protein ACI92E_000772 [Oceanicoccus sp.]|jgi:hypothetical protein